MKSVLKFGMIASLILASFVSSAPIKVQAQTDIAPKCVLAAVRDFAVTIGPGQTIEVKQGQQFLGKMYPNLARIRLNGIWYEVSRNNVNLVTWNVPPAME
jgi:hypothetical protein